jgi:ATP-dependent DNA ligase
MKPAKLELSKPGDLKKLDAMFSNPRYIAERKIDGCHYFCDGGRFLSTHISVRTGKLLDKSENFPHLVEGFLRANFPNVVLDGEINFPDKQGSYIATTITGCAGVQAVSRQEDSGWISYTVFDILRDPDGNWLYNLPWYQRRELLEILMLKIQKENQYFILNGVVRRNKKQFMEGILERGEEGIVLKDTMGIYVPGKRPASNWVKIKTSMTDDVVIFGFDLPVKQYTGKDIDNWPYWENGEPVTKFWYLKQIGSIVFGKFDAYHNPVTMGTCSGIDDATRKDMTEHQDVYKGQVMEIKAMERTPDGKYRHPNFIRIHSDKNADECILEENELAE